VRWNTVRTARQLEGPRLSAEALLGLVGSDWLHSRGFHFREKLGTEKLGTARDFHQFPFVEKVESVFSVPGFLKIDSYCIFLFQLPNPLLQELPLGFLLGQG
jgi:hypothetical protein